MQSAGVLIIKHRISKFFHISKSNAVYSRERVHRFRLSRGEYFVPEMQKLFDADPVVSFEIYPAKTPEIACRIERDLLAMEANNHKCLNNDWVKPEALNYAKRLSSRRRVNRNKVQEEEEDE